MHRDEVERATFEHCQAGFHCAEAILKAVIESVGTGSDIAPRVASGFGGGIGGSQCDTCGALTGGIIALGWLHGRDVPQADKTTIYAQAADFRTQFAARFGSTNCAALLERLGPQENRQKCKRLTTEAAGMLVDILARPTSTS